jgi:hypothetical protein
MPMNCIDASKPCLAWEKKGLDREARVKKVYVRITRREKRG